MFIFLILFKLLLLNLTQNLIHILIFFLNKKLFKNLESSSINIIRIISNIYIFYISYSVWINMSYKSLNNVYEINENIEYNYEIIFIYELWNLCNTKIKNIIFVFHHLAVLFLISFSKCYGIYYNYSVFYGGITFITNIFLAIKMLLKENSHLNLKLLEKINKIIFSLLFICVRCFYWTYINYHFFKNFKNLNSFINYILYISHIFFLFLQFMWAYKIIKILLLKLF